jgi:hypothetical protein
MWDHGDKYKKNRNCKNEIFRDVECAVPTQPETMLNYRYPMPAIVFLTVLSLRMTTYALWASHTSKIGLELAQARKGHHRPTLAAPETNQ